MKTKKWVKPNPRTIDNVADYPWAAANWLNKTKLTVDRVSRGLIPHEPGLVQAVLLISARFQPHGKRLDKALADLRLARHQFKDFDAFAVRAAFRATGNFNADGKSFKQGLIDWVEKHGLYDTPEGVKTRVLATYGYDSMNAYDNDLEQHTSLVCPHCDVEEVCYAEGHRDFETCSNWSHQYDHITAEYGRCKSCYSVGRIQTSPADQLPDNHCSDSYEWLYEDFVMGLAAAFEDAEKALKGLKLPSPDGIVLAESITDWRGTSGECALPWDVDKFREYQTRHGEVTLKGRVWLDEDGTPTFRTVMSCHDIPRGSLSVARPVWGCEMHTGRYDQPMIADWVEGKQVAALANKLTASLPGSDYSSISSDQFRIVARESLAGWARWRTTCRIRLALKAVST